MLNSESKQPRLVFGGLYAVPEAHDLKAFNSGSELGFFEFKNFFIRM